MHSPFLLFLLVSLIFLLSAGAAFAGYYIINRRLGVGRKSLRKRLDAVVVHGGKEDERFLKSAVRKSEIWAQQQAESWPALRKLYILTMQAGLENGLALQLEIILAMASLGVILGITLTSSFILSLLLMLLLGTMPLALLIWRAAKRQRKFEDQLPEALDYMSRAMRAGHGLTLALGMVGEELPAPLGPEFKRVYEEINFGIPFHEALPKLPLRMPSGDLSFFVAALLIQRETGGNLTELLRGLAATIRERIKLQGRVKILAAEGKNAGYLLGSMPFIMAAVLYLMNPNYVSLLWTTETGQMLMAIGMMTMLLGFAWMWKITQIKV